MPVSPDRTAWEESLSALFVVEPLFTSPQDRLHAAWLRPSGFPTAPATRLEWANDLLALKLRVESENTEPLQWDTYVQMNQLERPAGPRLISSNGSRWMPMLTAGVWPDRVSPEPLNAEDFNNMMPGVPLREPYFHLMRISAQDRSVPLEAAHAMAGTGALLLVLRDEATSNQSRKQVSDFLRERMVHEEMRSYMAYLPLFDQQSLEHTPASVLSELLQGVSLYLREDTLTHSVLLVSRIALDILFTKIKD